MFSAAGARNLLIGAALVFVGVIGGRAIDHRFDGNRGNRIGFGAMTAMMDDDNDRGAGGPQWMGGAFGDGPRDRVVGTVAAVSGDRVTVNTAYGDVTLTLGTSTTYAATTVASAADLTVGATIEVHLDHAKPMQAGEIVISK